MIRSFAYGLAVVNDHYQRERERDRERSQIDFIAATTDVQGTAYPANEWTIRDNKVLHEKMDHRPVMSVLQFSMVHLPFQTKIKIL